MLIHTPNLKLSAAELSALLVPIRVHNVHYEVSCLFALRRLIHSDELDNAAGWNNSLVTDAAAVLVRMATILFYGPSFSVEINADVM
jgi:hypothetical protein